MTDQGDLALDLLVYTRSFATLTGAGVSLTTTLTILEDVSDEPLASVSAQLRREIVEKERTLSAVMRERPDLFTPMYVAMVRVGEIGGVLDEALLRAADALETDWADWQATGGRFHSLLAPGRPQVSFEASPSADRQRILSQYFRSMALMLTSGVPILMALETAAGIVPAGPEHDALLGLSQRMRESKDAISSWDLFRLPFLPRFVPVLLRVGEETKAFDRMCDKVADLLDYQRRHYLLKHGS